MLGRDQPDERHELLGGPEPGKVADLADDPERRQSVDTAQTAQLRDQSSPRSVRGGVIQRALELLDPVIDEIDRVHVITERRLLGLKREPLIGEPLASTDAHDLPGSGRP